ncbi:hypothetical protein [uncultured Hymenobacter sp.]|uniref:hypothetical protein n=1 Tax=uncultured Hymenobacter sp. TaxID=170016 RepID=UPI0035CAE27C
MLKVLLFLFLLGAGPALAQSRPTVGKPNPRLRSLGRTTPRPANNKATFRRERHPSGLDLRVHDQANFRTAKANRNYTTGKRGRNRAVRALAKNR